MTQLLDYRFVENEKGDHLVDDHPKVLQVYSWLDYVIYEGNDSYYCEDSCLQLLFKS